MERVRIPKFSSLTNAIRIFYECPDLQNEDIRRLFPSASASTIQKLKRIAREQMDKDGKESNTAFGVNTDSAYAAWGLSIDDLERRLKGICRLKKMEVKEA